MDDKKAEEKLMTEEEWERNKMVKELEHDINATSKTVHGNHLYRHYGGTVNKTKNNGGRAYTKNSRKNGEAYWDLMDFHDLIESEDMSEEGDNPVGASTSALSFDQQNIMALGLLLINKLDKIVKAIDGSSTGVVEAINYNMHCSKCPHNS